MHRNKITLEGRKEEVFDKGYKDQSISARNKLNIGDIIKEEVLEGESIDPKKIQNSMVDFQDQKCFRARIGVSLGRTS